MRQYVRNAPSVFKQNVRKAVSGRGKGSSSQKTKQNSASREFHEHY